MLILRALLIAAIVVAVSLLSERQPRIGALLLSLPLMSILAFALSWQTHHDPKQLQSMARDTLILVPLGLPFFVPLAFASRLGLDMPQAFVLGLLLAGGATAAWLRFG